MDKNKCVMLFSPPVYVSSNPAVTYPGAQKAVMKVWEGRTMNGGERVAIGREVEITGRRRNDASQGTQMKIPSLDDVLKSIRGVCECNILNGWCTIQPHALCLWVPPPYRREERA